MRKVAVSDCIVTLSVVSGLSGCGSMQSAETMARRPPATSPDSLIASTYALDLAFLQAIVTEPVRMKNPETAIKAILVISLDGQRGKAMARVIAASASLNAMSKGGLTQEDADHIASELGVVDFKDTATGHARTLRFEGARAEAEVQGVLSAARASAAGSQIVARAREKAEERRHVVVEIGKAGDQDI